MKPRRRKKRNNIAQNHGDSSGLVVERVGRVMGLVIHGSLVMLPGGACRMTRGAVYLHLTVPYKAYCHPHMP